MLSTRLRFVAGKQIQLMSEIITNNFKSQKEFADVCGVNKRTVCNWAHERSLLPKSVFSMICNRFPHYQRFENFVLEELPSNWGAVKGGKKGIVALRKKYGPVQFSEWRRETAICDNLKEHAIQKRIKSKVDFNENLSELVGAYLGDGTLTSRFIRFYGDKRFDIDYLRYLAKLVKEVFNVDSIVRIKPYNNLAYLEVSSTSLAKFFEKNLGLKPGDKIRNDSKIPRKILSSESLAIACLRGLVDTDGSVSKRGSYLCLEFTSHNKVLLDQVYKLATRLGIFTHFGEHQTGTNKWKNIVRYFAVVGSSNLRHIIRFNEKFTNSLLNIWKP